MSTLTDFQFQFEDLDTLVPDYHGCEFLINDLIGKKHFHFPGIYLLERWSEHFKALNFQWTKSLDQCKCEFFSSFIRIVISLYQIFLSDPEHARAQRASQASLILLCSFAPKMRKLCIPLLSSLQFHESWELNKVPLSPFPFRSVTLSPCNATYPSTNWRGSGSSSAAYTQ